MRTRTAAPRRGSAVVAAVAAVAALAVPGTSIARPAPGGHHARPTAQAPSHLRVAGQAKDALIGTARPTLAWTVNDSGRAEAQTAYELRVDDVLGHRRDQVWDSGRTYSAASTGVAYRGPKLRADHTYEWAVRTWNREGQRSSWSRPQSFDVGPTAIADWRANWVQLPSGTLARRDFDVPRGGVARARLYVAAQGLVEAHVNGARVAPDQLLDSSVTDYAKRVVYRAFDVTDRLHKGDNALGLTTGKGQFAGTPTVIAQLDITYRDGSRTVVGTDGHWRSAAGPVTADDFYYGETYDARKEVKGWDTAAFDDSAWSAVPVFAPVSKPASLALNRPVTAKDETACCGWSRAALVDGIEMSTDGSEGYHSATASTADETKWVQVDLGSAQPIAGITLFPAHPTNDTAGDFPGAGFPVRYRVQVSDDPDFATATTLADRTDSDQPNPGTSPVRLDVEGTGGTGRYVRVTATKLQCRDTSCTFRLAELGVYGPHPATTWSVSKLEPDTTPPTRVVDTVRPVTTTTPAAGVRVYDFGQNYVGQVRLRAAAPAGTTATVVKGELLDQHGRVSTKNISFGDSDPVRQKDEYTFAGGGTETFRPRLNYAGFRYAEITGLPAGAEPTVVAEVTHNDVAQTGSFRTSNPLLNRIQGALVQTQLNDLQGMPLDCPTREKRGWLGDAGDTDAEAMANLDLESLYGKWLGDIRTSINADGSVPSVSPDQGEGSRFFTDPAWGTAYPQIVWDSYTQYGDKTVLRDNYAAVKGWVDYLATISNDKHIVTNSPGSWGDDWLSTVSTPHVYFQTLFYLIDSRLLANMAKALGHTDDAAQYRQLAQAITTDFTAEYFDAEHDTYSPKTQLAYAMPLALGIVPAGHAPAVLDKLVADIVAHDDHVTTGFVGTTYVYQALAAHDRDDVALAISERTDFPSFGYMLANGPGTIWEKWVNSSAPDGTSSKDHIGLAGSIGQWYYQHLAGIQPGTAGYRTFTLAPSVVGDLTHVEGSQRTVRGTIESSWRLNGSTLTYHARVPVGSTATIRLPLAGGAASTVRENGRTIWADGHPADADPGLTVRRVSGGALTMTAGSGDYTFTARAPRTPETSVSITSPTTRTAIGPRKTGDVAVSVRSSSTDDGAVALGAQAPAGWTVSATPERIPLTAGPTHTLASIHVTPPDDTRGAYPITLTARAPDGTTARATVTVDVYRTSPLYDFEDGTQGWRAGDNVTGVATATGFANGPGTPHGGTSVLEATGTGDASQWRTVSVTPSTPLDLSDATHLSLWMDSWGGLGGATYRARIVLHSGDAEHTVIVPLTNDTWNHLDVDISGWAQRNHITSIEVGFSAVGSTADWGGRYQLDDIGWTDQQS